MRRLNGHVGVNEHKIAAWWSHRKLRRAVVQKHPVPAEADQGAVVNTGPLRKAGCAVGKSEDLGIGLHGVITRRELMDEAQSGQICAGQSNQVVVVGAHRGS